MGNNLCCISDNAPERSGRQIQKTIKETPRFGDTNDIWIKELTKKIVN